MGTIAYNRDQRIANEIVDLLVGFNDAVSRATILRGLAAASTKYVERSGDYLPARVDAILRALEAHGAITKIPAEHNPADRPYPIAEEVGVDVYFIDPRRTRLVLEVARGQFQP